jgi:hypothetical protein
VNAPATVEGWQVWHLVQRLGGQIRAVQGVILGWDMGAALAMGRALGVPEMLAADLLPEIEAVMVEKLNAKEGGSDG